jgi:hypothetical protein
MNGLMRAADIAGNDIGCAHSSAVISKNDSTGLRGMAIAQSGETGNASSVTAERSLEGTARSADPGS